MTNKEQILKMIEGRIETMQNLAIESIELIYNAGYNDGVEKVATTVSHTYPTWSDELRKLKK